MSFKKNETNFAYERLGGNGFFVEAGAANNKHSSCFPLVEYGWRGICAEPFREWFDLLAEARPESKCYNVALGGQVGTAEFFHCTNNRWRSGIKSYLRQATLDLGGTTEEVEVVTLPDLLRKANAPKEIDWIALDTEGTEPAIIKTFLQDGEFQCGCISTEEAVWTDKECKRLLVELGYTRVEGLPEPCDNFWVL